VLFSFACDEDSGALQVKQQGMATDTSIQKTDQLPKLPALSMNTAVDFLTKYAKENTENEAIIKTSMGDIRVNTPVNPTDSWPMKNVFLSVEILPKP
jgi:hypothetical protein